MLDILLPKDSVQRIRLSQVKNKFFGFFQKTIKKYWCITFEKTFCKIDKKIFYQGFSLHYSAGTSIVGRFIKNGSYEPEEVAVLKQVALEDRRSTVFLDIGANIGMISLAVLHHVPKAIIYAFEPGEHQRGYLKKNISANQLDGRITISPLALSDRRGTALFAVHASADASGDGLRDTGRAGGCSLVEVQTDTLDNWWEENGHPAVT